MSGVAYNKKPPYAGGFLLVGNIPTYLLRLDIFAVLTTMRDNEVSAFLRDVALWSIGAVVLIGVVKVIFF